MQVKKNQGNPNNSISSCKVTGLWLYYLSGEIPTFTTFFVSLKKKDSIINQIMHRSLVISVLIFFFSCSDEIDKNFKNSGIITGQDFRRCMCCGGWFIDINSETYRFYDLPDNSDLDLYSEEFPVQVNLDWTSDQNGCLGDEILIERIEKITIQ